MLSNALILLLLWVEARVLRYPIAILVYIRCFKNTHQFRIASKSCLKLCPDVQYDLRINFCRGPREH